MSLLCTKNSKNVICSAAYSSQSKRDGLRASSLSSGADEQSPGPCLLIYVGLRLLKVVHTGQITEAILEVFPIGFLALAENVCLKDLLI